MKLQINDIVKIPCFSLDKIHCYCVGIVICTEDGIYIETKRGNIYRFESINIDVISQDKNVALEILKYSENLLLNYPALIIVDNFLTVFGEY